MKTAVIAATAIMALLVAGVATTVYASHGPGLQLGQSNSTTTSSVAQTGHGNDNHGGARGQHMPKGGEGNKAGENNRLNLTTGQTITLSGLTGRYVNAADSTLRGNATGSLTLQVTGAFKEGYTLSITSGTISAAGLNYAITGGSVELGPFGQWASGSGTTSGSGQFIIHIGIHGTSTTSPNARIQVDLKVGGNEYLVSLGSAQTDSGDS